MSPAASRRFRVTLLTHCRYTSEIDASSEEHALVIARYLFGMAPHDYFVPTPDEIIDAYADPIAGEGA